MYFVKEYCGQQNTLLIKYKRLKIILSHFKKRFYDEYILALRERHQYEVKKTHNHPILKINDIVLLEKDKPRIKWWKGKIIKFYDDDNLVRGVELFTTQKLKGKIEKVRRPLQMIVPLELRNDFNDNSDNNDKNDNNDNDENDNVNSDSLKRDDLDDLLDKTDLSENRKIQTSCSHERRCYTQIKR